MHWFGWQCSRCYYESGLEWREGDLPTAIVGGEVWTEAPREPESAPLALPAAYATIPARGPSKRYIVAVLVAIAIAALSIFAVLQQIGQPFVRILAALYRTLI